MINKVYQLVREFPDPVFTKCGIKDDFPEVLYPSFSAAYSAARLYRQGLNEYDWESNGLSGVEEKWASSHEPSGVGGIGYLCYPKSYGPVLGFRVLLVQAPDVD